MFRDKKSIETLFSSPRNWDKIRGGLFTHLARDLKPEERLKVVGERCEVILNSFLKSEKVDDVYKDPRLGKIVEFIISKSIENAPKLAKQYMLEFFALGGTPSEAEQFIKDIENCLPVAAFEVRGWSLPETKEKKILMDKEMEKLDLMEHEISGSLTTVCSRITIAIDQLRKIQKELHEK